ncbi:sensor histidine kinase KdpD [Vitreoscilla massiliensis]|uniref:histidine kinase n=1 Tax=Vitreoscilla massiliensis TaxID=1689272 RepID=A0ABY4E722_9NEIS|nr:sensor histidine kinase KdpD [Vitreoscilla massiliensis]UOO91138.1 sensor histidine kinase KdpD [Vitreoscilla massiliensis]
MQANTTAEQWLQHAQAEQRGKLRIYFGAVAGVGKTYRMLKEAQQAQAAGKRVLIGWVETHQRADTAAQLGDLPRLPPRACEYQGRLFDEFDLDAAIAAQPEVLIVDELAHSNVHGSRHPKRWQDIEELLQHGIDVWTALNVQHLESLNDVISTITGVNIGETVPDAFFSAADELVLVDVTANELLHRLQSGKIYGAHKIKQAQQHFFRPGNLLSLREIALRKTAEILETDVKHYRQLHAIDTVWATDAGLLCCITGRSGDDDLVRGAARLAAQWHCDWHVVWAENTGLHAHTQQQHAQAALKLAESLGAQHTAVLSSGKQAEHLIAYARRHNLARVATGKHGYLAWRLPSWLRRHAPDLDCVLLSQARHSHKPTTTASQTASKPAPIQREQIKGMALMLAAALALTTLLWPFTGRFDNSNVVMLYLLLVMLASAVFGRAVGIFTSVVTVALFDFAFVEPRFSFSVRDVQYLATLAVMLVVSMVISQLTLYLKNRARVAHQREQRAIALFDFAKAMSGLLEQDEILHQSRKLMQQEFQADIHFVLPNEHEQLQCPHAPHVDAALAEWAYKNRQEAGLHTHTLPEHPSLYLPLQAPIRIRGVLVLTPKTQQEGLEAEKKRQLQVYANLIALTLERVHFATVASAAMTEMETEKMRNTLLATLSHDLRTPLTAMMGEAEYVQTYHDRMSAADLDESLQALHLSAQNVWQFVSNLLEIARMESGQLQIKRQTVAMADILAECVQQLQHHHPSAHVHTDIAPDLPDIKADALLLSHAVANLLENSVKYSPSAADIRIRAYVEAEMLHMDITDAGQGLPDLPTADLFKKFVRGNGEGAVAGSGLGLAIGKWIVEAHHGRIALYPRSDGQRGTVAHISLPIEPV